MPTKIRLQRKGKKGQPFYHIVIADGRAPRDGKFIEKIGTYNPLTKPAGIDLNFDRALYWLQTGAQPTDTVRSILSYKGVMMKNHLLIGMKKGALTQEQVEMKFAAWLADKEARIAGKVKVVETQLREEQKKALDHERKVNEARAKELSDKRAAELKKLEAERAAAAPAEEETPVSEEAQAPAGEQTETVVEEESAAPAPEQPESSAGEETPEESPEKAEAPVKEQTPEEAQEETQAAETPETPEEQPEEKEPSTSEEAKTEEKEPSTSEEAKTEEKESSTSEEEKKEDTGA